VDAEAGVDDGATVVVVDLGVTVLESCSVDFVVDVPDDVPLLCRVVSAGVLIGAASAPSGQAGTTPSASFPIVFTVEVQAIAASTAPARR
jgi:hypothetical protein